MKQNFIRRVLTIGFITVASVLLFSCKQRTAPKLETQYKSNSLKDEWISDEVRHGLHKIVIDDTTTILIYRGVESCTMIQLK